MTQAFREIFRTDEIGECNLGENSQIEKVYLLNLDFSANWESFRLIGIFFSQLRKNLVRKHDLVWYREKAMSLLSLPTICIMMICETKN